MTLATKFVILFSRSIPRHTLTKNLRRLTAAFSSIWIHTAHNLTSDSRAFVCMNSHCPHLPLVPSSRRPMQPNGPILRLAHTLIYVHEESTSRPIHPYPTRNPRLLTAAYSSICIHTANNLTSDSSIFVYMNSQLPPAPSSGHPTQQTQNIFITFIQRRPNVSDVGPTFYKCYKNVLCLLGMHSNRGAMCWKRLTFL